MNKTDSFLFSFTLIFLFQVSQNDEISSDEKLGFIMFECGLEGITLKVVKKSHFEHVEGNSGNTFIDSTKSHNTTDSSGTKSNNATPKLSESKLQLKQDANNTPKLNEKDRKTVQEDVKLDDMTIKETVVSSKDNGNVSSCIMEFKMVWFNFAAPPRAPITRKIDYTRLDWNLLSTASPAINAWMNPSNRLAIRVVHMVRTMYRRSTATVACLMADAMEGQRITLTKVNVTRKFDLSINL